jgi:hypothetical protein
VEGVLTAAGQLAHASEFRFDYWHTEAEHRFFLVKKGWKRYDGRWCITDGNGMSDYWDGEDWSSGLRGPDAYRYSLEEALVIAKRLAFEENQRIVAIMENSVGGIRGGSYDHAARKET